MPPRKRTDTFETVDSLGLAIPTMTTDNWKNYDDDFVNRFTDQQRMISWFTFILNIYF